MKNLTPPMEIAKTGGVNQDEGRGVFHDKFPLFDGWIIAVSDSDGFIIVDMREWDQLISLDCATGNQVMDYLEPLVDGLGVGLYELSFRFWSSGPDYEGKCDTGLDLESCTVLWKRCENRFSRDVEEE